MSPSTGLCGPFENKRAIQDLLDRAFSPPAPIQKITLWR
jgi:hypothetical protein